MWSEQGSAQGSDWYWFKEGRKKYKADSSLKKEERQAVSEAGYGTNLFLQCERQHKLIPAMWKTAQTYPRNVEDSTNLSLQCGREHKLIPVMWKRVQTYSCDVGDGTNLFPQCGRQHKLKPAPWKTAQTHFCNVVEKGRKMPVQHIQNTHQIPLAMCLNIHALCARYSLARAAKTA
eukprot:1159154-Pelagomonas_calceolata.AAC.2